jgi:DNA-directed RNA polymerase specialized sigma subunit
MSDDHKRKEFSQATPDWEPSRQRPLTEIEAIMSAAPHEDPAISIAEMLETKEIIAKAFEECLTKEEMWIINAIIIQGMSMRGVAKQLNAPKTTVARIRDRGLAKLKKSLENNPTILGSLKEFGI